MSTVVERPAESEAPVQRGRLSTNLVTNVGNLVLSTLVSIWYVPFLVHRLGPAAYGLIPLATALTSYMSLITTALNSAVARFLTIAVEQGDRERANLVFNTSLWGSLGLAVLLLLPAGYAISHIETLVRVPTGYSTEVRWLFACATGAFLLNQLKTPFDVSTICRNRLDLRNLVSVGETLCRVGVVVGLFAVYNPRLRFAGMGILAGTMLSSLGAVRLWRVLTPSLRVRPRSFDWATLRSLTAVGGWVSLNAIGSLLYSNADLFIANRMCTPEQSGRYAALTQLPLVMQSLMGTIAAVFLPTTLIFFAREDISGLVAYLRRAMRIQGLLLSLPVALVCGFGRPLLSLWLGHGFAGMAPLLGLMVFYLCILGPVYPLFTLQLTVNRMQVPGMVMMAMGFVNLGLAILLAGPMGWGLYGIAAATASTLALQSLLFAAPYAAHVLHRPWHTFLSGMVPLLTLAAATTALCALLSARGSLTSWPRFLTAVLLASVLYMAAAYRWLLSDEERRAVLRMVPRGSKA
ncbi:MAG TPA: oligosaccharide flippase family protein [Armatimonadota bacterium]